MYVFDWKETSRSPASTPAIAKRPKRARWLGREAEIRALVDSGASGQEIAAVVGCRVRSVYPGLRRLGLKIDPAVATQHRRASAARINACPEAQTRRLAALRRAVADPRVRERYLASLRGAWADPAKRAVMIANNRRAGLAITTEEHRARAKLAAKTKMAWLPDEQRDRYRKLSRIHGAATAKPMILAEIAAAEEARRADLTPYERLLEDVRSGRRTVTERPVLQPREHEFTLGGVSADWF